MRIHIPHLTRLAFPALLAGVLACSAALAAKPPAFNVTGHWTGTVLEVGQDGAQSIDLQLQAGRGSNFTGSGTVGQDSTQVTVQGTLATSGKATLRLTAPAQHASATFTGKLTVATKTIAGNYTVKQPGKPAKKGTFTITQQLPG